MPPSFAQLGVPAPICRALAQQGITAPFEIQAATVADALAGRDICGRAPTGSGKTLAFGIPLVMTVERALPRHPRALVLAPTRELADQITSDLRSFAGPIRVDAVFGGVGYGPQLKALRRGVDILVACPGRLEDLVDRGDVDLSHVDKVVIDEADRMADMGFLPAVRRLLDRTTSPRQTVMFSATLDGDVAKLTRDYQRDPARHHVGAETPDLSLTRHLFWKTTRPDRVEVSARVVEAAAPAIIFCRTRHGADRLARQLAQRGIRTGAIHGGRNQKQRSRALDDFIAGRTQALVATDVAARGIHVDDVGSVIHYDPPADHKAYIHRSGRTARAGRGGVVVSLIQPDQVAEVRRMQRHVGLDQPVTAPDHAVLGGSGPRGHRPAVATRSETSPPGTNRPRSTQSGTRRPETSRSGTARSGATRPATRARASAPGRHDRRRRRR
jgi:superfamily II DNA/RNA helicase